MKEKRQLWNAAIVNDSKHIRLACNKMKNLLTELHQHTAFQRLNTQSVLRWFTCKCFFLHLIVLVWKSDKHPVAFIMENLSNRRFVLRTSGGQENRARRLKNGVPQGSILAVCLFNIYISDIPTTLSTKLAYADDLALAFTGQTSRTPWTRTCQYSTRTTIKIGFNLAKKKLCMSCTILTHVTWDDG